MKTSKVVKQVEVHVVTVAGVGPPGASGTGSASNSMFITDITATGAGVVGVKTHPVTIPVNAVLSTCTTDTKFVRVTIGVVGGSGNYSPTCTVNGVAVTLSESSTKRWFVGYADIEVGEGTTDILAVANTGGTASAQVTLAGRGPNVLSCTLGALPGTQTACKAGDTISFSLTVEAGATEVTLLSSGASSVSRTFAVVAGAVSGTLTVGSAGSASAFSFKARNSLGTYGDVFTSTSVPLDQVYPSFSAVTVVYPGAQGALGDGEVATVSCTVSNQTSVSYSATGLSVPESTTYTVAKVVTNTSTGVVLSGTNYSITAVRSSNATSATVNGLVNIITVAPTAAITTSPSGRMVGSPTGILYEVRVTPSQTLTGAPTLSATLGVWSGSWSWSGVYWKRSLQITDSTAKGTGVFSALDMTGVSNIHGTTISAGSTYTVGGFSARTLTYAAFSRVAAIGLAVSDQTKVSAQIVGGNTLTRYTDAAVHVNGFYIANADGSYNATGSYLGLSDSAFAGSNTSGTLQVSVQEVA